MENYNISINNIGILGFGEIGQSLNRVYEKNNNDSYNILIRDPYKNLNTNLSNCDIINICIPYFGYSKFIESLKNLNLKNNCIIIIHSTIEIDTTNKLQNDLSNFIFIHSPVRGVHPNLYDGLITFDKYVGISDKYYNNKYIVDIIKNHILSINMKPKICRSKESELAKIISTTLYGVNIAAVEDVGVLCDKFNVDFNKVYTEWQNDYNIGYRKLGMSHVQRPLLTRIPNKEKLIGGHCVVPNAKILENMIPNELSKFVLRYSNDSTRVHKTNLNNHFDIKSTKLNKLHNKSDDVLITHLGHAGLMIENDDIIIICDPWIEPGAFDDSWFQYPRNEHMKDFIINKLNESNKDKYIYVSHEHKDHYDPKFLNSLPNRDFTIIIANFRRTFLLDWFNNYKCKNIICLNDSEEYVINNNARFRLAVEDCEMNRDSGFLIKINGFVIYNGNDCKYPYYNKLNVYGDIDVFAQQFSGATWHPISYDYTPEEMDAITVKKRNAKRQTLIKYIENLNVKTYIPSAGPPVFLDDELHYLSLAKYSVFPRADWIRDQLIKTFNNKVQCPIFMPGDTFSLKHKKMVYLSNINRVNDYNYNEFVEYITKYKNDYKHIFEQRKIENNLINNNDVFNELIISIQEKLDMIKPCDLSKTSLFDLYILLNNYNKAIKVDFKNKTYEIHNINFNSFNNEIKNKLNVYTITVNAWQINKVLTGELTWEEMMITFRPKLSRRPDKFSTLLTAFLFQQNEDLEICFNVVLDRIKSDDKIVIETPLGEHYEICRKCPHQGQDMSNADIEDGRFLICPKHCWKFDLHNHGNSINTDDTLNAIKIHKPPKNTKIYKLKNNEFDFIDYSVYNINISDSIVERPICTLQLKKILDSDSLKLSNNDHIIMKINNTSRPYTFIMDELDDNFITLYIKLYPDGSMSNLIKNLKINDIVNIKKFITNTDYNIINNFENLIFIAGGTGIAPFYRIIKNYMFSKNITLIYSNTVKNEILLKEELDNSISSYINLHYYNYDEFNKFIDKDYLQKFFNNSNINISDSLVLICGPSNFTSNISNYCKSLSASHLLEFDS